MVIKVQYVTFVWERIRHRRERIGGGTQGILCVFGRIPHEALSGSCSADSWLQMMTSPLDGSDRMAPRSEFVV